MSQIAHLHTFSPPTDSYDQSHPTPSQSSLTPKMLMNYDNYQNFLRQYESDFIITDGGADTNNNSSNSQHYNTNNNQQQQQKAGLNCHNNTTSSNNPSTGNNPIDYNSNNNTKRKTDLFLPVLDLPSPTSHFSNGDGIEMIDESLISFSHEGPDHIHSNTRSFHEDESSVPSFLTNATNASAAITNRSRLVFAQSTSNANLPPSIHQQLFGVPITAIEPPPPGSAAAVAAAASNANSSLRLQNSSYPEYNSPFEPDHTPHELKMNNDQVHNNHSNMQSYQPTGFGGCYVDPTDGTSVSIIINNNTNNNNNNNNSNNKGLSINIENKSRAQMQQNIQNNQSVPVFYVCNNNTSAQPLTNHTLQSPPNNNNNNNNSVNIQQPLQYHPHRQPLQYYPQEQQHPSPPQQHHHQQQAPKQRRVSNEYDTASSNSSSYSHRVPFCLGEQQQPTPRAGSADYKHLTSQTQEPQQQQQQQCQNQQQMSGLENQMSKLEITNTHDTRDNSPNPNNCSVNYENPQNQQWVRNYAPGSGPDPNNQSANQLNHPVQQQHHQQQQPLSCLHNVTPANGFNQQNNVPIIRALVNHSTNIIHNNNAHVVQNSIHVNNNNNQVYIGQNSQIFPNLANNNHQNQLYQQHIAPNQHQLHNSLNYEQGYFELQYPSNIPQGNQPISYNPTCSYNGYSPNNPFNHLRQQ